MWTLGARRARGGRRGHRVTNPTTEAQRAQRTHRGGEGHRLSARRASEGGGCRRKERRGMERTGGRRGEDRGRRGRSATDREAAGGAGCPPRAGFLGRSLRRMAPSYVLPLMPVALPVYPAGPVDAGVSWPLSPHPSSLPPEAASARFPLELASSACRPSVCSLVFSVPLWLGSSLCVLLASPCPPPQR